MPTRLFTDGGGELYDADGNLIMMVDAAEIPEFNQEPEEATEALYEDAFKSMSFSAPIKITKKQQKQLQKYFNAHLRNIRRIKRKKEQMRRELLKKYGPERYHVMMRALRNVETYWYELHGDMIPIEYDDGNFHVTMYTDEGGISVNVTEKYQGPIEVKVITE